MTSLYTYEIETRSHDAWVNIMPQVEDAFKKSKINSGQLIVFIPHTTAGVTINENADPDVAADLLKQLDEMVPWRNNYRHMEGNSAAHLKASMMGSSVTLLVEKGCLCLGTWQSVFFTEFDGPRHRKFYVKCMQDAQ